MASKSKASKPDVDRFIAEYVIDRNGTRAAIAAGYAPKSAAMQASRLLKSAKVSSAVSNLRQEVIAKVQRETGITLERTLREIARGAFHDARKFFDDSGNLKKITDLDDETATALAGFEANEITAGENVIGSTKKVKLADRKGYLDMLMKHLGGYEVDNSQKNKSEEALPDPMDVARRMAFLLAKAAHEGA